MKQYLDTIDPHAELRAWECNARDLDEVTLESVLETIAKGLIDPGLCALGIDDPNSDEAVALEEAIAALLAEEIDGYELEKRLRDEAYERRESEPYSLESLGMTERDFL